MHVRAQLTSWPALSPALPCVGALFEEHPVLAANYSGDCNSRQGVGALQAVDLQPEEPAMLSQHSTHVSLRERLLRFNVAVLRIVAAACAGLPDSKQASRLCCIHMITALRWTLPQNAQSPL